MMKLSTSCDNGLILLYPVSDATNFVKVGTCACVHALREEWERKDSIYVCDWKEVG